MSRTITIGGTDRADLTRLESFSFQESAYRGEVGQGGFDVESPAGAVTVPAWKDVLADDSDGGRVFTGQTIDRGVGRGSFTTDAEATWDVQIVDINTILDDPLLRGDEWNRPEETDVARMQFLVSWLNGEGYTIGDDYLSTADPETLDAYNYKKTGSYPRTIADTCAEQAAKSFYLFYDEGVTDTLQLWYGKVVDNTRVSAYRISSVEADIDDYGTTWPAEWPEESGLQRDPSRVYSAVQVIYGTTPSQVFVSRAGTAATFKRRETSLFDDSVTGATSATRLANYFLDNAETEDDTVTVAVTVPTTHVNAFQHGQNIEVKFPHLGYDTFTPLYCVRRTIEPAGPDAKAPDRYHVILVLKSGVKITRFGGRGDQPEEPPGETTPDEPADIEIVTGACASMAEARLLERTMPPEHIVFQAVSGSHFGDLRTGSWVYYNQAWSVTGCPIGGGAWVGYNDLETWCKFTAPADSPDYLGLYVTIDATGVWWSGEVHGYYVGTAPGEAAAGRYGTATRLAAGPLSGSVTIYLPRSHVAWGEVNSIVLGPEWECARDFFTCNDVAYFGNPHDDGRGASGEYRGIGVGQACPVRFLTGSSGLSGEVAAYGDVDGTNRIFTLIDWDGTGLPEHTVNGLEQPAAGIAFNRTTGTATLSEAPPAGSIVLWSYTVGSLTGDITLTPDALAVIVQVPEALITPPIDLLPQPTAVEIEVPEPTVTVV